MRTLEEIKEEIKIKLENYGYENGIIEEIINDIVKIDRPGIVLVRQKICGEYTGKLSEMYL